MVSMSLSNSVEFQVRRHASGSVPSPTQLDHGDLLVMDGLAQSEYVHRTVSGLQGPRVHLTFRWIAQHIATCPLTGVMCCALPSCVQGLVEPGLLQEGRGESQWSCFWVMVLLFSIWVCFLLGRTRLDIWMKRCYSGRRPPCPAVHSLSRGPPRWVGSRRWRLSRRSRSPKRCSIFSFAVFSGEEDHVLFSRMWVTRCVYCWIVK